MAKGLLTDPPKLTRVSPGVYRNAQGQTVKNRSGGGSSQSKKTKTRADSSYRYLNESQKGLIKGQEGLDTQLQGAAGGLLPQATAAYSQPFDWSHLKEMMPMTENVDKWRDQQLDQTYNTYNKRLKTQYDQENQDFEQQMHDRGIPIDSPLYAQQKALLAQQQSDSRQALLTNAMQQSGQEAQRYFDIGTQGYNNAYSQQLAERNMPLNEYNQLIAAQSPMTMNNLQYSQGRMSQTQKEANDRYLQAHQKGGGGGGGGSGPVWAQYGFSSPQEYDAYKTAQARSQQQWQWENAPGQGGPGYGAQVGGSILGGIFTGLGNSLGNANWFE